MIYFYIICCKLHENKMQKLECCRFGFWTLFMTVFYHIHMKKIIVCKNIWTESQIIFNFKK